MRTATRMIASETLALIGLGLGAELPDRWLPARGLPSLALWWLVVVVCLWVTSRLLRVPSVTLTALMSIVVLLGVGWSVDYRARQTTRKSYLPRTQTLTGTIASYPLVSGRQQQFVLEVVVDHRRHRILVTTTREPRFARGLRIELTGPIQRPTNAGAFDYPRYLAARNIFLVATPVSIEPVGQPDRWWQSINLVRDRMLTTLNQTLPEPAASLAAGLTLGVRPTIDTQFATALQTTNLTHLSAVSGENVSLFILVLFGLVRRRWLRAASLLAVLLTAQYAILVGGEASVLRAAVMTSVFLLAPLIGRPAEPIRLLLLTALILTLISPLSLTRDVGFQLSFCALAGILLIVPLVEQRLPISHPALTSLLTVLAATVAVLPIQLATFNSLSSIGPLANLIVTVFVEVAMAGSLILGLAGFVSLRLAQVLGYAVYIALATIHRLTIVLARLPFASLQLTLTPAMKIGLYAVEMAGLISLLLLASRSVTQRQKYQP